MMKGANTTVRFRLTLLLASLVVASGAILLGSAFLFARSTIGGVSFQFSGTFISGTGGRGARSGRQSSIFIHKAIHHTDFVILVQYGLLLAVLVVCASLAAWFIAGRMLRPLQTITETTRRITSEDLHERLSLSGRSDELKELGDTIDSMLGRLEASFDDQRLFAANAAHELRTPLALMGAELDLLLTGQEPSITEVREIATKLRQSVDASERLIERLLTLARGSISQNDQVVTLIDELFRVRLALIANAADQQDIEVRATLCEAFVRGDPWLLGELIDNLLDNALKYNSPGGWISVETRATETEVTLEVANSGSHVKNEDLAQLVQPFRRAGQPRVGRSSGLGLSIVRTVVQAHDGQLSLSALDDGGIVVRATFPIGATL
ncbi:MAG TPA: HAMP domain-containing sensor histidine kinase [Acidimicrobiales bacterium]|jgi:hypothetical protein|nr:HAMP domain-containing sensor histidine kinase [Acidimicrobiales bacterium]